MLRSNTLKFPHWLSSEIASSVYIFFRMLIFENHLIKKLKAIYYGTFDDVQGRMGKIRSELYEKLAG